MAHYVVYFTATGAIKNVGEGNLAQVSEHPYPPGQDWLEVPEYVDHSYYINLVELVAYPKILMNLSLSTTSIMANASETATVTNIPIGTVITNLGDGWTATVNDGVFEFSVDMTGTYTFHLTAVQYLDEEFTIEAVTAT